MIPLVYGNGLSFPGFYWKCFGYAQFLAEKRMILSCSRFHLRGEGHKVMCRQLLVGQTPLLCSEFNAFLCFSFSLMAFNLDKIFDVDPTYPEIELSRNTIRAVVESAMKYTVLLVFAVLLAPSCAQTNPGGNPHLSSCSILLF